MRAQARWRYRAIADWAIGKKRAENLFFDLRVMRVHSTLWLHVFSLYSSVASFRLLAYFRKPLSAATRRADRWLTDSPTVSLCYFQVQRLFTSAPSCWTCATHLWAARLRRIFPAIWWRATKPPSIITTIRTKWMDLIIRHSTTISPMASCRRRKISRMAGAKLDGHPKPRSISSTWIFKRFSHSSPSQASRCAWFEAHRKHNFLSKFFLVNSN